MVVMMYVPLDAENETATTTTDPATTLPSTRGRSPRQDAHFHAHPIDLPAMNVEMHSSYFADVGFPTCPSAYDLPVDDGAGTNGSLGLAYQSMFAQRIASAERRIHQSDAYTVRCIATIHLTLYM